MHITNDRPPAGIEIKAAASVLAPRPGRLKPDGSILAPEGVVELIGAVTGIEDEVNDILVPGCFTATLATRRPKVCANHRWDTPIGRVLDVRELHPGDQGLPTRTGDGRPWPADAGALLVTAQLNLDSKAGREAFEIIRFFGPEESAFSIGYRVKQDGARTGPGGTRFITELDLFEVSLVLHGANRYCTGLSVKSAVGEAVEYKATTGVRAQGSAIGLQLVTCDVCKRPGGMVTGGLDRGQRLICSACIDGTDEVLAALQRYGEIELTSEEEYEAALRDEQPWQLEPDGRLRRGR